MLKIKFSSEFLGSFYAKHVADIENDTSKRKRIK
jgi:hypothetical protein